MTPTLQQAFPNLEAEGYQETSPATQRYPMLGHGLLTVPPGPDRRSPSSRSGDLRSRPGHGQETVPQRGNPFPETSQVDRVAEGEIASALVRTGLTIYDNGTRNDFSESIMHRSNFHAQILELIRRTSAYLPPDVSNVIE